MKKSELQQIIKEEISKILNEDAKVISKEFGGYNDSEFLKIAWKMSIDDLEKLLLTSIEDLKWLKKNSKGTLGLFNKKDAQWVNSRIKFIKQIINSKKKNPNFIPDHHKTSIYENKYINPVNKYFHDLANEGEELVRKMKNRNGK
jgi:hypothetical protein